MRILVVISFKISIFALVNTTYCLLDKRVRCCD